MDALELHFVNKHGIVANINKKTIAKQIIIKTIVAIIKYRIFLFFPLTC
jgi:hypothetical protein